MKKLIAIALLLLVPTLAFATAETLRPNDDTKAGDTATDGYTAAQCGGTGTICNTTDCSTYIDDATGTGDANEVGPADSANCINTNYSYTFRYGMTVPTPPLYVWSTNTQTLKVRANRSRSGGSGVPSFTPELFCNGTDLNIGWSAQDLSDGEAEYASFTFTNSQLGSCSTSPAEIEVDITCTGVGGSAANRSSCVFDAIQIDGDFLTTTTTTLASGRRVMIISETHDLTDVLWDLVKGWFAPTKAEANVTGGGLVGGGISSVAVDPGVAPNNWTSSMDAVWLMESSAGQNVTDEAGGDDTLTNNGTTGRVTGIQGTNAADLLGGTSGNYFTCPDATCRRTDPAANTSFSYGCWIYSTDADTSQIKYTIAKTGSFVSGYFLRRMTGSPSYMDCWVWAGGAARNKQDAVSISNNSWEHLVCTVADGTDVVHGLCRDGSCATSTVVSADYTPVTNTNPFYLSGNDTFFHDGYWDECFFDNAAWTSAQASRTCSIGIDGSLGRCVTATQTDYLPCDTNADCGGTALCATGGTATDNTYCNEGTKAGCCMGRNVSHCGGTDLAACNASAP